MDESNPKPLARPASGGTTPAPTSQSHAPTSIDPELVFPRGSGDIGETAIDRREHSVMEGLPEAKIERIASIYRELAELQKQLIAAQQRIATEIQGRVDDAERFEALEARLQAHELEVQRAATRTAELERELADLRVQHASATSKAEELRREVSARDVQIEEARKQHRDVAEQLDIQSSSLLEAKAQLATRETELAARSQDRDAEHATRSRLEQELEDARKQHGEVITTRDTQLATITSERDALKGELEKAQRELDAARAKARDVASQLMRFGQELDGTAIAAPNAERAQRSVPPPVPSTRPSAQVETILEVTDESQPASSRVRTLLLILGGVILGCVVTIAVAKASNSTTTDQQQQVGASAAPLETQPATEPAGVAMPVERIAEPPPSSDQPMPASNPQPQPESNESPAAPANPNGVILLPGAASGHRVFVDGHMVEVKSSRTVVPCGSHEIRIGSRGTPRTIDVACGAETALPSETTNR